MQRLIKGLAVGIFCLQWSLPASAQNPPVTCGPIGNPLTGNPLPPGNPLNASSTNLDATGIFQLTCTCPDETKITGGFIKLSIVPGQSMTRNGSATIMFKGTVSPNEIVGIPYEATTNYAVNVSAPTGEILQSGNYFVAVSFELSTSPQCQPDGGGGG
jgi:hypothetical protein